MRSTLWSGCPTTIWTDSDLDLSWPINDLAGMTSAGDDDSRFTKSRRNQGVQRTGRDLLLTDRRFRDVSLATKRQIIRLIGKQDGFGTNSFDLVMLPTQVTSIDQVDESTVEPLWSQLRLVEMKATRKSIKNAALNSFFFGVTANEIRLAELLGEKFLFAFVVLNGENDYRRPFARLLTLPELRERTRPWRTQFQVNFRSDLSSEGLVEDRETILVLDTPLPPND